MPRVGQIEILEDRILLTLAIAATDAVKAEGNAGSTSFTFTVTRSNNTVGTTTVDYAVSARPVTATDFVGGVLPSGTVTFLDGETTQTITILVNGDTTVEGNEDFTVTLSNPSPDTEITTAAANGTIRNDDGNASLAIAATDSVKAEGNQGTTNFTFTVTRSTNTIGTTTVDYEVTGEGLSGELPGGTVTFADGETTQIITIPVTGDTEIEPDEDFTVTLSDPSVGAVITTAAANGTIRNDDGNASLAIAATDAVKAEGNAGSTSFTFTVTRSDNTVGTTTVDYAVSGAPVTATDFVGGVLPSGTVTFAMGKPRRSSRSWSMAIRLWKGTKISPSHCRIPRQGL